MMGIKKTFFLFIGILLYFPCLAISKEEIKEKTQKFVKKLEKNNSRNYEIIYDMLKGDHNSIYIIKKNINWKTNKRVTGKKALYNFLKTYEKICGQKIESDGYTDAVIDDVYAGQKNKDSKYDYEYFTIDFYKTIEAYRYYNYSISSNMTMDGRFVSFSTWNNCVIPETNLKISKKEAYEKCFKYIKELYVDVYTERKESSIWDIIFEQYYKYINYLVEDKIIAEIDFKSLNMVVPNDFLKNTNSIISSQIEKDFYKLKLAYVFVIIVVGKYFHPSYRLYAYIDAETGEFLGGERITMMGNILDDYSEEQRKDNQFLKCFTRFKYDSVKKEWVEKKFEFVNPQNLYIDKRFLKNK